MTVGDISQETYTALSANKVRSGLTILGIVIGISSVIIMISIGQGAQLSIQQSIQSIGSNLIIVMPGAARGPGVTVSAGRGSAESLTVDDANALGSLSTVAAVAPEVSGRYQITARGENTNTQVIGTTAAYTTVRNVAVDQGTFITDQDVKSINKVAVLGPTARDDLFGTGATNVIGQTIRIKQVVFRVIGITQSKGGSGFNNPDDVIYIPLSAAQQFLAGGQYVSDINVEARSANVTTQAQQDITNLLLARHHISNPQLADFSTLNQADIIATAGSVTQTFTILLAAVAGISLLVGGIGIMNMMLTTVTERTREIGLRKAIGATKRDINIQFLIEAITLTFMGGLTGVLLGVFISFGISHIGILQTQISLMSIILAFGVSALIGIVFGYYPARRASRLSPMEALRYE